VKKGCGDWVLEVLKCFKKKICTGDDKVGVYSDFFVLADRYDLCTAELRAGNKCLTKGEK
jgi:hypothetical protein